MFGLLNEVDGLVRERDESDGENGIGRGAIESGDLSSHVTRSSAVRLGSSWAGPLGMAGDGWGWLGTAGDGWGSRGSRGPVVVVTVNDDGCNRHNTRDDHFTETGVSSPPNGLAIARTTGESYQYIHTLAQTHPAMRWPLCIACALCQRVRTQQRSRTYRKTPLSSKSGSGTASSSVSADS